MMDYMLEAELLSSEEESVESPPWAAGNHLTSYSGTEATQPDPTDIFEGYPSAQADFSEACQQNASDVEESERSFRALK